MDNTAVVLGDGYTMRVRPYGKRVRATVVHRGVEIAAQVHTTEIMAWQWGRLVRTKHLNGQPVPGAVLVGR